MTIIIQLLSILFYSLSMSVILYELSKIAIYDRHSEYVDIILNKIKFKKMNLLQKWIHIHENYIYAIIFALIVFFRFNQISLFCFLLVFLMSFIPKKNKNWFIIDSLITAILFFAAILLILFKG